MQTATRFSSRHIARAMAAISSARCLSAPCQAVTVRSAAGQALRQPGTSPVSLRSTFLTQRVTPAACHVASRDIRRSFHRSRTAAEIGNKEAGAPETLEYRIFFTKDGSKEISPWHDIPLSAGPGLFNMICEIPKETSAKMEVATDEPLTPIKQDTKKGKLRFYPYCIHWNYGMLPQTWEDPSHMSAEVENCAGDNDPLDVVEISSQVAKMGEVYAVKPLAVLAMIDEGELDWKVVCIRADDPKANEVDDIEDVEKVFPGELEKIRVWFQDYKVPDGKPQNKFGLGNKAADKATALKVISETHEFWASLVKRVTPAGDLSLV